MLSTRVLLAVPTYRRPAGLRRLLAAVNRLHLPDDVELSVLVLDNDACREAGSAVLGAVGACPFDITYRVVPKRGLSQVRNAALDAAISGKFDYLGFIDDDEAPSPRWLVGHLSALNETGAAGSMGPVHAVPGCKPPSWIGAGGFLDQTGPENLATLVEGATSNTVFSLEPVVRHGLRFDSAFDKTGGEDTVFFDRYIQTGAKVVFAAGAPVFEWVPEHRLRLGWLFRRWRRTGQTNAWLRLVQHGKISRMGCATSGLARLVFGSMIWVAALPLSPVGYPAVWARGARIAARGIGYIDTALGRRTLEYANPDR